MARQISRKTVLRSVVSIGLLLFLVYQEFMFTIIGDTSYAFDNELLDMSIIPFALVGGLYGYVVSFICFLVIFIIKLFTDGYMAHVLAIYMLGGFSIAMAAQYRRFRTIPRTIFTFVISIVSVSLVAAMNEMARHSDFTYNAGMLEGYLSGYSFSLFITCLVLFLFFRFAPDAVKSCFPIGIGYTREYVSNLLLQNQLKKTRLSVKITLLTGILTVVMGASAALFANILIPDMRIFMERRNMLDAKTEMAAPPDDGGEMPPGTDEPVNRQREYGVPMRVEDTAFDTSYLLDSRLMAFNLKLFLMLLCVAFPIVGLINFFAKMKIGTPIGELSSYMMSFMDTTDDNRLEYAESIHQMQVNTHDEISELYHAISSTVMEITEYIADIQEEARLREELKVAQAASEAKSGFLSNMSHEIRTPINAVLGMDEMILRETHEPEIRQYAADIRSAGNTLLSLVNDILDFSKIEAGKMDILPVQYQLSSTINDLVNMIRDRASAKGLAFNIQVDETVPNLLYGDEIRLKQCVTNILTNAVKYTNEGSVTLNIGWHEAAAEEETADAAGLGGFPPMMLTVRVTDTGIGIKEEDLGKLFSPFERIEEIRNRTIEGTGLGMSIVKKLLAMMETKLVVHSVYGKGSDFSFEVRQGIVDPEPMGDFATRYKEFTENLVEYRESFQAPEARILVTDDTRINLTVIRGLLKQTRIGVDTAESGRETLRKICENHYDVIFLDHMMPEMDGIETRAAMADLSGNLNVDTPCITLTANAVSGAREEYLAAGFADYLSKPVDPERLERMLMEYLPPDKVLHEKDPGYDAHATDAAATETAAEEADEAGVFAACTGIDVPAALAATGSPEVLADVLRDFYESIPEKSDAIEQFAAAGDLKNYTVQVHALKSSARIIGAEHLSSLAAQMEAQGNTAQGNGAEAASAAEEIRLRTPELLTLYRSYREHLAAMDAPQEEDPGKPEIDAEELASALSNIRELAEAYDLITAEQILQMLDAYRIPAAEREKVAEVRQAMRAMDRERLLKVIS